MIWWCVGTAIAGSGPWVVGDGGFTLYTGAESQRFAHLVPIIDGKREVIPVAEGVSTLGLKAIGTVGFGGRAEVQLAVPWYHVEASRADEALCVALALGACETTEGIGIVESRVKGLVLDEFFGAPFSLSLAAELRFGQFTASDRERVTNLGEGTFDAGPVLAVGRTGGLGKGYWSGWIEGSYRYRVPMTRNYPQTTGKDTAPGSEFTASTEVIVGPRTAYGFGPTASLLWRPFGRDFGALDLTDVDRFGALKVTNLRVGAVAVLRANRVSTSASVLRTVYASNNPTDGYVVSLGVQFDGRLPGVGDG
ncbi:MAG: hypothetical protein ABMB14_07580 [Myxococcota bacterium]